MQEPSLRTSRLAIAGGILAVFAVGGAGFLLGRATAPDPEVSDPVVTETPAPQPSPTPEPVRILGRADIIELAEEATDALVAGEPAPAGVRDAIDRRFELAVPFGCAGPAGEESAAPLALALRSGRRGAPAPCRGDQLGRRRLGPEPGRRD